MQGGRHPYDFSMLDLNLLAYLAPDTVARIEGWELTFIQNRQLMTHVQLFGASWQGLVVKS